FLGGAATTADDSCLVVGSFANPGIVAREGDLVPGMAATVNGPWRYGPFSAGSGTPFLNGRGQLLFPNTVTDSVVQRDMWFGYDPTLGIQIVLDGTDTFTTGAGSGVWTSVTTQSTPNSGDASPPWFNNNGDFAIRVLVPSPVSALIVRGHIGSLIAEPSSVPITGNVPQNFHIDCGVAQAGKLFLVLATGSGTRPGFVSPFGGQQVPLNPIDLTFNTDLWFNLSLNNSNSIVWPGTLGFLDGNGRNINPASFVMPPGFPVFQGVTLHHAVVAFDITFGLQTTFASEASAVKLY
ncbi:MAG: hypothetical protein JNM25_19610, partial [Planctomycetes bacterium]|nr:hypothetical protein [Planctomycetota bacterium]